MWFLSEECIFTIIRTHHTIFELLVIHTYHVYTHCTYIHTYIHVHYYTNSVLDIHIHTHTHTLKCASHTHIYTHTHTHTLQFRREISLNNNNNIIRKNSAVFFFLSLSLSVWAIYLEKIALKPSSLVAFRESRTCGCIEDLPHSFPRLCRALQVCVRPHFLCHGATQFRAYHL